MTFTNVSLLDLSGLVIPSADAVTTLFDSPASYYNKSKSGVPYSTPNMDVYKLMAPVNPSDYRRSGSNIELLKSKKTQIYGVYDGEKGKMLSGWMRGTGGAYTFSFSEYPSGTVIVVTRMAPSEKQIDPVIPSVDPGADLAFPGSGDGMTNIPSIPHRLLSNTPSGAIKRLYLPLLPFYHRLADIFCEGDLLR